MRNSPSIVSLVRSGLLAIACVALLGACSFSHSSDSSSDSSNHSSDSSTSSSDSSSPDRDNKNDSARFDADVEHYTRAFLEAGGRDDTSFYSGLGDLARQHGVSDWESQPGVWEAIGRGLARSPASAAERTAYQTAWTGGDAAKRSAVAKGIASIP